MLEEIPEPGDYGMYMEAPRSLYGSFAKYAMDPVNYIKDGLLPPPPPDPGP